MLYLYSKRGKLKMLSIYFWKYYIMLSNQPKYNDVYLDVEVGLK